jgi:hypothetical protein
VETEGESKLPSAGPALMALTGVLGEAMDLGVEELSEWLFETVSAEGIKVEEDDDRELDRSEPC